jgi:hypothetical protein
MVEQAADGLAFEAGMRDVKADTSRWIACQALSTGLLWLRSFWSCAY